MSSIYIAMNQPLTTKYLKKGESSVDIDQLVEDVNELKQDVAGIEEVDETQNTDITNLKSDVQTLQTSDLTQEAAIDKLRHQIILASGYLNNNKAIILNTNDEKATLYSCDFGQLNISNIPQLYTQMFARTDKNDNGKKSILFNKYTATTISAGTYHVYKYYTASTFDNRYGYVILNALGEQVLNNHLVIKSDFESGAKYLEDLINLYGTEYYKEHVNDQFNFDLIETNLIKITNISEWMKNKYTSSDFDAMTNLNNWVNSKVSTYDPTNSIKTDLTSTWTSSDYETMTNLKDWVESKAGGTTPTTTLKCPVDMYISTDGITDPTYSSHQVPFRISSASYKIGGNSCDTSGYYISFHAELEGLNHITSMTILAIKQGQTFPTFSWDSLCKFYKADFSTSDAEKYGGIYFIMSDGTVCFSSQIGRAAFILNEPKYVHFLTETIILDQLKNNVCKISNEEIEASTATYDTTRKPYYKFKGTEGSYRSYYDIEAKQN